MYLDFTAFSIKNFSVLGVKGNIQVQLKNNVFLINYLFSFLSLI